jgi:hypothetical protein
MTPGALDAAARGYRSSSSAERGAFGILASCATTIGISRAVTLTLERRRRAPWLRSLGRRGYNAPRREGIRIHHFAPGILVSSLAGAIAILDRDDGRERWLGLCFGTGTGLTLDELALLVKLNNPYWGKKTLVLIEGAAAALGALAMAVRFHRAGAEVHKSSP